jgi:hypothetical protein
LDTEDLGSIGEGQIPVQFGTGPDVADFQAAVGVDYYIILREFIICNLTEDRG